MPGFDGTGPRGMGPMTGGGVGFCTFSLRVTPSELDILKNDLHSMKEQVAQLELRIENLIIKQKGARKGAKL